MKLALPFAEALSLATAKTRLPTYVRSVDLVAGTVRAEIALDALPIRSTAVRLAAAVAGTVTVTARLVGYTDGVATLAVTAHAWNLPAHKLLPFVLAPVNKVIRDSGLPDGLVRIESGAADPLVLIDVQKAVETKVMGVTVTDLQLLESVIHVDATIGTVVLH